MNHETRKTAFIAGMAVIALLVGVLAGFFAAHRMMGEMPTIKRQDMTGTSMKEMGMSEMQSMTGMPGLDAAPSGAVAVPAVARQLIGVRSASAAKTALEQEIRAVGTVDYDERRLAQVTLKVSGWIRKVFVNSVGRPVRQGEPLFTLYAPDLLASQDEYLLAVKMQAQLAASPLPDAIANASSLVASARDRLRLWDLTDEQIAALERRGSAEPVLTMYAPAQGIVLKREAVEGKYVEPGTILYELADLSTVWVLVDIYEADVKAVRLNQPVSATFAAYPGDSFDGKVAYVYPTLNTDTRTVRVRVELPNQGLKLKPGMYGNVILRSDSFKTLAVPKEAVLDTGLRQLVFRDRGEGRYEPIAVKVGRRAQDHVEVLEGLAEGDRIVTSANFLLDAESKLASASSMQAMMGRIGMGDWQMRGAYEGKMEGMEGMQGMKGMQDMPGMQVGDMPGMKEMGTMPGMEPGPAIVVAETRQVSGLGLSLSTVPEKPKAGEVLLKLKLTDQAGQPVTNAHVLFVYTMPMPGMTDSKAPAAHIKDGVYEGKVMFGMGGTWVVTVNVTIPGKPPIAEKFQFSVVGGGM